MAPTDSRADSLDSVCARLFKIFTRRPLDQPAWFRRINSGGSVPPPCGCGAGPLNCQSVILNAAGKVGENSRAEQD